MAAKAEKVGTKATHCQKRSLNPDKKFNSERDDFET